MARCCAAAANAAIISRLQRAHPYSRTCNSQWGSARPGDYHLSVTNAKTRERLPGSPFALAVRAAAADAARSSAAFIDGAKPARGGAPGAAAAAEAAAGVPVTLAVTLRDRFGNLAPGAPAHGAGVWQPSKFHSTFLLYESERHQKRHACPSLCWRSKVNDCLLRW